ncbi:hypothetical protein WA026_007057 [Henosepilachna vigintioctopunctata]|uniref:PiggyBac transposable element-derived protein domain-containing protein n=1 Tax=Henosepilachna vigintioctopunctata TaxID=420089 RepID=A0AAW1V8C4_9CUCU
MADNSQGPSNKKKPRLNLPNTKKAVDEEVLVSISYSSDEDGYNCLKDSDISESDCSLEFDDSESEEDAADAIDLLDLLQVSFSETDNEDGGFDTLTTLTGHDASSKPPAHQPVIPNWSDIPIPMCSFPFSQKNELLVPIPGNNEPIDFFRLLFDDDILNLLVSETNTYAEALICSEGVSEKSRITRWKPVCSEEMLKFVALILHTGTIKMNRLQDFWKCHPLFNLTCFSAYMSRDRFLLILRCLHFTQNMDNNLDRLQKIRPIINFFNNKMSTVYNPGKELSLDEPMILWKRRLVFRHCIKKTNPKYGIKLYMLTEPNGLILKSLVYSGELGEYLQKGHTTEVVLDLLEGYLDSGHSVYMDELYNSFELAHQLTNRNTYCSGFIDKKRIYNPKEVLTKKLKKCETIAKYSHNVMVAKWRNKRDVLYISNEFKNDMVKFVDKRQRKKEKPAPIFHFNKYNGSLQDIQDQLLSFYPCDRISLPWFKKLGVHFIYLMLFNSHLLYNKYSGRKMSLYDFRISILKSLLNIDVVNKPVKIDDTKHFLTKITSLNSDGRVNRKRCKVCSVNKIRKLTRYHCEKCPKQPGFCVGICFEIGHN